MSVTIKDLLQLSLLADAKVVAGHEGLDKIITSVSVMESANEKELGIAFEGVSNSYGKEIFITAFMAAKDNVEEQCNSIRRIYTEGAAALVVYYVGSILKRIDEKVISLANELSLPIIVMPNNLKLRYGDLIVEIAETVINDRNLKDHFATEVIEQLSHFSESQKNIQNVVSVLRDRTQCSIFLIDEMNRVLNFAEWPSGIGLSIEDYVEELRIQNPECSLGEVYELNGYKFNSSIAVDYINLSGYKLEFVVIKDEPFTKGVVEEIKHVLATFINLWTHEYGKIDTKQLVSAIINNEPEQMRRIGNILHINVADMSGAYFIYCGNAKHEELVKAKMTVSSYVDSYGKDFLVDIFDDTIAVMCDRRKMNIEKHGRQLLDELNRGSLKYRMVACEPTGTTGKVRLCYWIYRNNRKEIERVFPCKEIISITECEFIAEAKQIMIEGDTSVIGEDIENVLLEQKRYEEMMDTIATYYLDADMSMSKTAELMYLHINSVKHRVKQLEELLGHKLSKVPELYNLYVLAIISRLRDK